MKTTTTTLLMGLVLLSAKFPAWSQGTFTVNTSVSYDGSGPATAGLVNGANHLVVGAFDWGGVNARAALYIGPVGSTENQLVMLVPTVGFGTGVNSGNPLFPSTIRYLGISPGTPAVVQVRAWDTGDTSSAGASFEDALSISSSRGVYLGKSSLITTPPLGGTPSPLPPDVTVPAFTITWVPEPSVMGLAIFGALTGLLLIRRRQSRRHP